MQNGVTFGTKYIFSESPLYKYVVKITSWRKYLSHIQNTYIYLILSASEIIPVFSLPQSASVIFSVLFQFPRPIDTAKVHGSTSVQAFKNIRDIMISMARQHCTPEQEVVVRQVRWSLLTGNSTVGQPFFKNTLKQCSSDH